MGSGAEAVSGRAFEIRECPKMLVPVIVALRASDSIGKVETDSHRARISRMLLIIGAMES